MNHPQKTAENFVEGAVGGRVVEKKIRETCRIMS